MEIAISLREPLKQVILLGHPTSKLSDRVREAADKLTDELKASGANLAIWRDGWYDPNRKSALDRDPRGILVQPLPTEDAHNYVSGPSITSDILFGLGAEKNSRIIQWLPKGEQHKGFRIRAETDSEADPDFRTDAPSELAHYLALLLDLDERDPEPSIQRPGVKKIVVSYRRSDTRHVTGRLSDYLIRDLGPERVFIDVDSIPPGLDFVNVLTEQVASCHLLLAVIGRDWLSAKNNEGNLRLFDRDDWVRIEVEAALSRNIPVIPVLVDGAPMPRASSLPKPLKPLARRQYGELTHIRFASDMERLIKALRHHLGEA